MTRPPLGAPDALTGGAWRPDGPVLRWVPGGHPPLSPTPSTGPVENVLPEALGDGHAAAMSNIDGCPECVTNTEPPRSAVPVEGAWRCGYLCSSCGHAWTTDWRD